MGVKLTNTHVKFGRTVRLGKNLDLDDAVAGEVEVGSQRDTGVVIERWDGTQWVVLGPGSFIRDSRIVTSNDNVLVTDDLILVDATDAPVTMTLFTITGNQGNVVTIKKIDASANAMIIDGNGSETIDGELNITTTTQYNSYDLTPSTTEFNVI